MNNETSDIPENAHITARIDIVMYLDLETNEEIITHTFHKLRPPFVTALGMLSATEHTIVSEATQDDNDE